MQRRALVVGVIQYSKVSLGNFVSFANNANAIADILEPTFKVKRLPETLDGDRVRVGKSAVTCDRLQNELKELFTAADLDMVLFYFSGHGLKGKQLFPRTYLAASDSEGQDDGYRRAFEIEDLKSLLKNCPAREQIVWLDCCYGGDLANFAEVCDRNDGKTRFIITASRTQDPAYQEIAGEMGVFTKVLGSALARTGTTERRITCAAIEDAVRENLQQLQYPQMPQFYRTPNKIIEFWERRVVVQENQDFWLKNKEKMKKKPPQENLILGRRWGLVLAFLSVCSLVSFVAVFVLFLYGIPSPIITKSTTPSSVPPDSTIVPRSSVEKQTPDQPHTPVPSDSVKKYSESEFQRIKSVINENLESIGNLLIKGVQPGYRSKYVNTFGLEILLNEEKTIIHIALSVGWKGGITGDTWVDRFGFKINKEDLVHNLVVLEDDGYLKATNVKGTELSLKEKLDRLILSIIR